MRQILTLVLLLACFPGTSSGEGDPVDVKEHVREFRAAMKSKSVSDRVRAVQAVAKVEDKAVAAALAGYLKDRHPKVRAEVGRALGAQGLPRYLAPLLGKLKGFEKDDSLAVVGYLDGIAALAGPKAIAPIEKVIRSCAGRPGESRRRIAVAAAKTLGSIRERKTVGALIDLLPLTKPTGVAGGYVSEEIRIHKEAIREAIYGSLGSLTHQHIRVMDLWPKWWKKARKGFVLPTEAADIDAGSEYVDETYGFRIEKPGRTWKFLRPTAADGIVQLIQPRPDDPKWYSAKLLVEAYSVREFAVSGLGSAVSVHDEWARDRGFDRRPSGKPWIVEGPTTKDVEFAGVPAKLWSVRGRNTAGTDVRIRRWVFQVEDLLFTLSVELYPDATPETAAELDRAIESFRLKR